MSIRYINCMFCGYNGNCSFCNRDVLQNDYGMLNHKMGFLEKSPPKKLWAFYRKSPT